MSSLEYKDVSIRPCKQCGKDTTSSNQVCYDCKEKLKKLNI